MYAFSKAQAEVAELLIKGLTNQEIADKLFVCEKTVKFHITSIFKIANVKCRSKFMANVLWDKIGKLERQLAAFANPPENMKKHLIIPEMPR